MPALAAALATVATAAKAQDPAAHWRALTLMDVEAAHGIPAEDHPGAAPEVGDAGTSGREDSAGLPEVPAFAGMTDISKRTAPGSAPLCLGDLCATQKADGADRRRWRRGCRGWRRGNRHPGGSRDLGREDSAGLPEVPAFAGMTDHFEANALVRPVHPHQEEFVRTKITKLQTWVQGLVAH